MLAVLLVIKSDGIVALYRFKYSDMSGRWMAMWYLVGLFVRIANIQPDYKQ